MGLLLTRALERDGIDLLGRNEQQRIVAAIPQLLGDRQPGKEMPPGSSTSNGNFHR